MSIFFLLTPPQKKMIKNDILTKHWFYQTSSRRIFLSFCQLAVSLTNNSNICYQVTTIMPSLLLCFFLLWLLHYCWRIAGWVFFWFVCWGREGVGCLRKKWSLAQAAIMACTDQDLYIKKNYKKTQVPQCVKWGF